MRAEFVVFSVLALSSMATAQRWYDYSTQRPSRYYHHFMTSISPQKDYTPWLCEGNTPRVLTALAGNFSSPGYRVGQNYTTVHNTPSNSTGQPLNPCWSNPCQNGGICSSPSNRAYCRCRSGFYGMFCQYGRRTQSSATSTTTTTRPMPYDGCVTDADCLYNGMCYRQYDGDVGHCFCHMNYTGEHCENFIGYDYGNQETTTRFADPCDAAGFCYNGGSCRSSSSRGAYCTCRDGFTGTQCQYSNGGYDYGDADVNDRGCQSDAHCSYNGVCFVDYSSDRGYCMCYTNHTGERCETFIGNTYNYYEESTPVAAPISCEDITCYNGGSCTQTAPGYAYCTCTTNYYGTRCQYRTQYDPTLCNIYHLSENVGSTGAVGQSSAHTVEDCKDLCTADTTCLGFDWFRAGSSAQVRCWLILSQTSLDMASSVAGVTQYRKTCDNSGTTYTGGYETADYGSGSGTYYETADSGTYYGTSDGTGTYSGTADYGSGSSTYYYGPDGEYRPVYSPAGYEYYSSCYEADCIYGYCESDSNGAYCVCYDMSYGKRCQYGGSDYDDYTTTTTVSPYGYSTFPTCYEANCQHGSCVQTSSGCYCSCYDSYFGERCQHGVDTIDENPCINGGSYYEDSNGRGRCDCYYPYTGRWCEMYRYEESTTPAYQSGPCQNGGTYVSEYSRRVCICRRGYTGRLCESYMGETSTSYYDGRSYDASTMSPYYDGARYANDMMCGWRIDVPSQYAIRLDFYNVDLEHNTGCSFDSIKIYDARQGRHLIHEPLCGTRSHVTIQTNSNHVLVDMSTDDSVTRTGFHTTYRAVYVGQGDDTSSTMRPSNDTEQNQIPAGHGSDKQCYQCEYVRNGKVEAGRDCKDPVVHHSIANVPCKGLCYIIRESNPDDDVEIIERGCSDHIERNMCYDTNYIRDGHRYDESCCGTTLCNSGILHPSVDEANAAAMAKTGATTGPVATIIAIVIAMVLVM